MQKLLYGLKSDENLMLSYQQGKLLAFEVLYGRHKDGLVAFLFRQTGSANVVEDLAQETWIAVVNNAAKYRVTAKFRTYLFQIAHHKWIDYLRRENVRPIAHADASLGLASEDGSSINYLDLIEDETADPELILSNCKTKGLLNEAVLSLVPEQRDVFLLREDGFSQAEIASIVGAGQETVKSRLRYAGKHLRSKLVELNADVKFTTDSSQTVAVRL